MKYSCHLFVVIKVLRKEYWWIWMSWQTLTQMLLVFYINGNILPCLHLCIYTVCFPFPDRTESWAQFSGCWNVQLYVAMWVRPDPSPVIRTEVYYSETEGVRSQGTLPTQFPSSLMLEVETFKMPEPQDGRNRSPSHRRLWPESERKFCYVKPWNWWAFVMAAIELP